MGMYTGIRAKVKLRPEVIHVVKQLVEGKDWDNIQAESTEIQNMINEWRTIDRCDFIPHGALCYMPWDDTDPEWKHRLDGDIWIFQCSLKNYEDEIEFFFDNILCYMITDIIHLEELYEEWAHSRTYEFKDGKIQENGSGVTYEYED